MVTILSKPQCVNILSKYCIALQHSRCAVMHIVWWYTQYTLGLLQYPSETDFKFKSREIPLVKNIYIGPTSFWKFVQSTSMTMPCFVQNYTTISQIDLGLRCVTDRCPIVQQPQKNSSMTYKIWQRKQVRDRKTLSFATHIEPSNSTLPLITS